MQTEMEMKLTNFLTCRIWSKIIALIVFGLNYLALLIFEGYTDIFMVLVIYPSISFFSALAVFILVRILYWVFNGFNRYEEKCD